MGLCGYPVAISPGLTVRTGWRSAQFHPGALNRVTFVTHAARCPGDKLSHNSEPLGDNHEHDPDS